MKNRDYLKREYKQFSKFIEVASINELEYFILDGKYTEEFNKKVKALLMEVELEVKNNIEISVIFDTNGNIAIIDSEVIGKYIAGCYNSTICNYYKEESLNKLVKEVINGTDKAQSDFIHISYSLFYNILGGLYSHIKCSKDLLEKYKINYGLLKLNSTDEVIIIVALLLVEDIHKYISAKPESFMGCIEYIKNKNNITN